MEDFETLSDSEKASSIRSKIKNIQYVKYNLELDILAENAISEPNTNQLEEWSNQISDLIARENVLKIELDEVLLNVQ